MPTLHQMFLEAMIPYRGQSLDTKKIGEIIIDKFPDFNLGSNLPNDHSDVGNENPCWCAGTNSRIFNRVRRGKFQVVHETSLIDDLESIQKSIQDETTRKTLIDARIGQGKFRQGLIDYWKCCAVTKINLIEVLKASHIKPWAISSNSERLDIFNGLLLSPNLDSLFDQYYISFNDDGTIIISPHITNQLDKLGVSSIMTVSNLSEAHFKYLKFHRDNFYKKISNDAET